MVDLEGQREKQPNEYLQLGTGIFPQSFPGGVAATSTKERRHCCMRMCKTLPSSEGSTKKVTGVAVNSGDERLSIADQLFSAKHLKPAAPYNVLIQSCFCHFLHLLNPWCLVSRYIKRGAAPVD